MSLWTTMIAAGLLTFLIRWSFIAAQGRYTAPLWFSKALPFVPVAALSALVAPDLLLVDAVPTVAGNTRLAAGLVAIAAAWRWKNATLTIGAGFTALLLMQAA